MMKSPDYTSRLYDLPVFCLVPFFCLLCGIPFKAKPFPHLSESVLSNHFHVPTINRPCFAVLLDKTLPSSLVIQSTYPY